jgi:hypothetical protein
MIYMLTVILVLVEVTASAIVVIAMCDLGAPAWRRWRQRQRASSGRLSWRPLPYQAMPAMSLIGTFETYQICSGMSA